MFSLRRGLLGLAVTLAGMAGGLMCGASAAQAGPQSPTQDPFYSWTGSLTNVANGTVLRTRRVTFDAHGLSIPVATHQLLFRTTNELGEPTVAVTTVVQPLIGTTKRIVSYQWAYDGLASNCDPSYAIQGGTPTEDTNAEEQLLTVPLLLAGNAVVISDYEGEDNDFAAGRAEGQITLDGITAAESFLGEPHDIRVGLEGYSGGAIATDWAAELAPSYAPALNIVGAAMGGVAVDLDHNLNYVDGSAEWSGAIPAALVGISRAFNINLSDYLSSYGMQVADAVANTCLQTDLGSYPGLTVQQMLKPPYTNIDQIAPFVNALNQLIMGTGGVPTEPIYMGIGDADGVGDDVMVDADDEALAHEYCNDGLPVELNIYRGESHGTAGASFEPQADLWLIGRLAGLPARQGCADIPPGGSLAPLTLVSSKLTSAAAAAVKLLMRYG